MIDTENFKRLIYESASISNMLEKASASFASILEEIKQKKKNLLKVSRKKDEIVNY